MKNLRRILILFEILTILGIVFCVYLLIEHLYPDLARSWIPCGKGLRNSCINLTYSRYSVLLGIPVAAYALFFYIFILFTQLVAEYAGEKYFVYSFAVIFPLLIIALLIDAALIVIFIYSQYLNIFWIITIIINLFLFKLVFYWYAALKDKFSVDYKSIYKDIINIEKGNPDKKAAFALYIIFSFFLVLSLYLGVLIAQGNKVPPKISVKNIKTFLSDFYKKDQKKLDFPATPMTLGNKGAKVKIVVFTDFFCSACYKFYKAEQYLFSKYGKDLYIQYYNFPLDGPCGDDDISVLKKSCIAARAFLSAALMGKMEDYLVKHYQRYSELKDKYNRDIAVQLFFTDKSERNKFKKMLQSDRVDKLLKEHGQLADKIQIDGVPLLYINGRELDGIPNILYLDEIIKRELITNQ